MFYIADFKLTKQFEISPIRHILVLNNNNFLKFKISKRFIESNNLRLF